MSKELINLVNGINKRNEARGDKFILLSATIIGKQNALKFWLNELDDDQIKFDPIYKILYKKRKIELDLLNELFELTKWKKRQ